MLPFSRKNVTYEEFTDKAHDEKSVWHHFLRAPDKQSAKCKKCKKELKCTGGSTTGLHKHLRSAHLLVLTETKFEDPKPTTSSQSGDVSKAETLTLESPPPLKKTKLTEYFQSNNTVETRVARMVCLDGIAMSKFCTSADLRELFYNSKLKLHRSPNSIKKMVVEYAVNVQKALRVEITTLKAKGCKFSLTFDEWTSSKNRRYINLNVHSEDLGKSKFRNLGLIRIYGSMPAEKCIELLGQRLCIYNLSLSEDIIGITTDGASVMAKVGRILNVFHQLCFAHGIQLAVLDVLYKKVQEATAIEELQLGSDDDSDTENDEAGFEVLNSAMLLPPNDLKDENIREIIDKVRAVANLFRNSPTKNDILQKYVKDEFGREMAMTRDCKTRWNSMADMLKRFLVIKNCISKALIDIQSHITFSEKDFQTLETVENSLDIVKSTIEVLCRREANLHTAETAIKFMIRKLKQQKNIFEHGLR